MTAPNGHANGIALDNPKNSSVPTIKPRAGVCPSVAPQFSTDQLKELERISVREAVKPLCGYQDGCHPYPCGAPATVTDIETGCTFCAMHFREAIL